MESGGGRTHVALLVALWFACNVGVLLLNKTLLSTFGFGYPVFLTACHVRPATRRCEHACAHASS
jgi:hypothetical protein